MDKDLFSLADTYGTPLYIYDFDRIKEKVLSFKEAFFGKKLLLCYALKANSNLSLLSHLAKLDCGADCVSINEVKKALLAGIPKYKIIYSGVGKSDKDIEEALNLDILLLNLESIEELLQVESIAKKLDKIARISIRVNPNIDAKTHPYISTGLKENKFGVSIESAKKMYIYSHNSPSINPVGIHFHIGSQLTELSPILQSAERIAKLVVGLKALNIDLKFIDIGGGLGIKYQNEATIDVRSYASGIFGVFKGLDLSIICEPGRYIVGDEGILLSTILYEKQHENKRFCIIDAAMNDLIRPSLYNAKHKIEYKARDSREALKIPALLEDSTPLQEVADIVGPICESGDYLAKDIKIPRTKQGDLIVIKSAGAYGMSMSSNYNSRLRAAEVAKIDGNYKLIRKRESFDDLIANEIDFIGGEK